MTDRSLQTTETEWKLEDFNCISDESALLSCMDQCYANGTGIRVIGSGWSWNTVIQAGDNARNVVFTGQLAKRCDLRPKELSATVSGGLQLCDFNFVVKQQKLDMEWIPCGICYLPNESQTFAGFLATNVHHSHVDTAFKHLNSVRVAVFIDGKASIVTASQTEHTELFHSLFGGMGMTGIIVSMDLKLQSAIRYDNVREVGVFSKAADWTKVIKRVVEPGCTLFLTSTGQYTLDHVVQSKTDGGVAHFEQNKSAPADEVMGRFGKSLQTGDAAMFCEGLYEIIVKHTGPCTGKSLPRSDLAWFSGRCGAGPVPMAKEQVPMPASIVDVSLSVPLPKFDKFMSITESALFDSKDRPGLFSFCRFVPKSGGGICAANCDNDVVVLEFIGLPTPQNNEWITNLFDKLYGAGLTIQPHVGKSLLPHSLTRESLSPKQRERMRKVMEKYDSKHVFDSGKSKFTDVYSLKTEDKCCTCS